MASTKEVLNNLRLSEAETAGMTAEEIAEIETALEEVKNAEFATARNPDRFDAKGMVPVDFPEGKVVPWKLVDEDDAK